MIAPTHSTAGAGPRRPLAAGGKLRHAARAAALLAAALAAGPAGAQSVGFGSPVAVPAATPPAQAALAPYTAPPALDLFVAEPRATASAAFLYRNGDLASVAFPWPSPLTPATCFAAGSWAGSASLGAAGDGLADLGWCRGSALGYQFSPDLSLEPVVPLYPGDPSPTGLAFARLLDRTDLVLAIAESQELEIAPDPRDVNFQSHLYRYPYQAVSGSGSGNTFALQPLRLGNVARSAGLHDLAWSRVGVPNLFVLWTLVDSPTADAANWGGAFLGFSGALEVRGAGAVDFTGGGIPDLVAVVAPATGSARFEGLVNLGIPFPSSTVIDVTSMAVDLGAGLGLVNPSFAAPLDLAAPLDPNPLPAAAVFDAGTSPPTLHVLTARPGGGLLDWPAATNPSWGTPTQILAGDLLGSPAADLVAVFADGTILVWPGDLPPSIAWAPGSPPPGGAVTVAPLDLSVDASDPDGQVTSVALAIQGLASGIAPVQSGTLYTFTVPIATLCTLAASPGSMSAAVRATDDLSVWREVAATIPISDAPAVQLAGAGGTLAVPLLPGGTTVTLTAQVYDGCGRSLDVTWSDSSGGTGTATVLGAGTSTYTIAVPESAYPTMVAAGAMSRGVTVTATVVGNLAATSSTSVTLAFDASGLVAADHRSDRTALAPGELALLTTTLRSRIGLALAPVVLDDRLAGLVPAGPVRVSGAQVLVQAQGPAGLSLTLDQLPGGGAPVVVELPVKLLEGSGGSSRAQALAAPSLVPLSPASEVQAPAPRAAGLGCGSGGGSALALLALALYVKARRRERARVRSASSRIPMRWQA